LGTAHTPEEQRTLEEARKYMAQADLHPEEKFLEGGKKKPQAPEAKTLFF
jgi:hypothetical protein